MPKHEHFTNGRCLTFGTGLALMLASFGAQASGWAHWLTIGVGYGSGVVLMLLTAVLITRSYVAAQAAGPETAEPEPAAAQSDLCEGLFTPAQIAVLRLRQGLIDLLASEPMPKRDGFPDSEARFLTANRKRDARLTQKYEIGLKAETVKMFTRLQLENLIDADRAALAKSARWAEQFDQLIQTLWAVVPNVKEGQ